MAGPLPLGVLLPFAVSWLLTAGLIRWAPRLGLVDKPDPRKSHAVPTPSGGGLAIYAGLLATWLVAVVGRGQLGVGGLPFPILALGLGLVLLGLIDDLRPLPWQLRLGVQFAVAGVAVVGWMPTDSWPLRAAGLVWVVGLVNAFNMLDNMDALSGGTAAVAAGALAVLRWWSLPAEDGAALPCVAFVAAVAGFLWFNRPPARIFMGDAGSTFLGFALGLVSLDLTLRAGQEPGAAPGAWAAPLAVLAVPYYDLATVVLLRLRQGRSPFHADRQHLSHRLVALGLSRPAAVGTICLMALASGTAGLLLYRVPDAVGAALVGLLLACCWAAVAGVEYVRRLLSPPPSA
ncbi:MAG TPA: MraY family glycosyltransferase [Gemmataceae bacterium]|nr:MraY family glycosyltransferase [Gemmataceae bacterium]